MKRLSKLTTFTLSLFLLGACGKYEFSELTPTLGFPLVHTRFGVQDLFGKRDSSNLVSGNEGELTLIYKNNLLTVSSTDLLSLNNQEFTINQAYTGPTIPLLQEGQSQTITGSQTIDFSAAAGVELYSILYKLGALSLKVNSTIQHDLNLKLSIPKLSKNGSPFVLDIAMPYVAGVNPRATINADLANYKLDLTGNGNEFNKLTLNYEIQVNGKNAPLTSGENIELAFALNEQNYELVEAYLGKQNLELLSDSILIKLFQFSTDEQQNNSFGLTDPKFKLTISNSFAVPFQLKIEEIVLKNVNTGENQKFVFNNFENPFNINAPLVPGNIATTTVTIDRNNSNIRDLLSPSEKQLNFLLAAQTNPDGKSVNKISSASKISVNADMELPLSGYSNGWTLLDTTAISFSSIKFAKDDLLRQTNFRLNVLNGFPVDLNLQAYFLDSNNVLIDSLFTSTSENTISAGISDNSGRVIQAQNSRIDATKQSDKSDRILKASRVVIYAKLKTPNAANKEEVRIYDNCFFEVSIGVAAQVAIKL